MTYYVGIDIAKFSHMASIVDDKGSPITVPFEFLNTQEGFKLLLETIQGIPQCDLVFGFESTAHYHENLMHFLKISGYTFRLLNPILTKRFRGLSIRDVKNDRIDAETIALFLAFDTQGKPTNHSLYLDNLYHLSKERDDLKAKKTRELIRLTAYLDRVFPELKGFIGSSFKTKGFMSLLGTYSTAHEIAQARVDRIQNILNSFRKNCSRQKASAIKELAIHSVGFHSMALSLCLKTTISQINLLNTLLQTIESEIIVIMKNMDSKIMQIPGMGYLQGATILSVIGDINRFQKPEQLVAYAGLDPKVRQSGQFNATNTRMSKRGNRLLRYATIWAAHNATRHSKTMHAYYVKKRSENKSHYNALGHCGKKLLHYVFFILKNTDVDFVLD